MHVPLRLIGPAIRGLVLRKGKSGPTTTVPVKHQSRFNWTYKREKMSLHGCMTSQNALNGMHPNNSTGASMSTRIIPTLTSFRRNGPPFPTFGPSDSSRKKPNRFIGNSFLPGCYRNFSMESRELFSPPAR